MEGLSGKRFESSGLNWWCKNSVRGGRMGVYGQARNATNLHSRWIKKRRKNLNAWPGVRRDQDKKKWTLGGKRVEWRSTSRYDEGR